MYAAEVIHFLNKIRINSTKFVEFFVKFVDFILYFVYYINIRRCEYGGYDIVW